MILAENEKTDLSQVETSHLIRLIIIITVIPFIIVNNTGSEILLIDEFDYMGQNHINLFLLVAAKFKYIEMKRTRLLGKYGQDTFNRIGWPFRKY